jgi:hypothetical protein
VTLRAFGIQHEELHNCRNLKRYLGLDRPAQTKDLIRDNDALEDAVSPQIFQPLHFTSGIDVEGSFTNLLSY